MLKELKDSAKHMWWLVVVASVASILFGIATLFMPGVTLVTLIVLFAVFLMVNGIIELVYGFSSINEDSYWWVSALVGLILLGASIYLAKNPGITAAVFILTVGWVLIARGVYDIAVGIFQARSKALWIISGIFSAAAGIIIWVYPVSGGLAFAWVLGLYALINGALVFSSALATRTAFKQIIS